MDEEPRPFERVECSPMFAVTATHRRRSAWKGVGFVGPGRIAAALIGERGAQFVRCRTGFLMAALGALRVAEVWHSYRMENDISFGPDPLLVVFWALLCSPPALITSYLFLKSPTTNTAVQLCCMLIFPLAPLVFASRFRATFSPTEFVYRRWGPTVRVPYSDIARIETTNLTPISNQAIGAFIVTRDGRRLPFWPKLFPKKAIERFFALAR